MEPLLYMGLGLIILGLSFVAVDFFLVKLLCKIYPNPSYWDQELGALQGSPRERKRLENQRCLYERAMARVFRKWGVILLLCGGIAILVAVAVKAAPW